MVVIFVNLVYILFLKMLFFYRIFILVILFELRLEIDRYLLNFGVGTFYLIECL